jgi:SNF2 family DNA or RNA helicase
MASFDYQDGQYVARCTYDERVIFSNARWVFDPKIKRWTTPDDERARGLYKHAVGQAKERLDNIRLVKHAAVAASWAESTETVYPAPAGLTYMPFQSAGIEYAMQRTHTLIADSPGLGKTVQAVGVANATNTVRNLVICPASLKVNWSREWRRWDVNNRSIGIVMSIPQREPVFDAEGERARDPNTSQLIFRTWTKHDWPDTDVVIVNYDMLDVFDSQIKTTDWDLVICDEAHLLKTATTIRSMCVFGGKKPAVKEGKKVVEKAVLYTPICGKRFLYLTGTPILSKPVELWNIIKACDPKGLGKNWMYYVHRYCDAFDDAFGLDTTGASNLEELNQLMRERFMVRRDKEAVLKDLPPKTRELIMLPADRLEKPIKKERSRVESALASYEAVLGLSDEDRGFRYIQTIETLCERLTEALARQDRETPSWQQAINSLSEPDQIMFTELAEAREEVALAKVGLVVEHVQRLTDAKEPVILFAYHKSVVGELKARLERAGLRVGVITGDVQPNKRQDIVDAFQNAKLDVIIGNILAMGVGFTLTRARFVVFAELDWVPAMIEQAEDRAWRHGQKNAVVAQHLVVDGSIEARMAIRILEKMGIIYEALDYREAA